MHRPPSTKQIRPARIYNDNQSLVPLNRRKHITNELIFVEVVFILRQGGHFKDPRQPRVLSHSLFRASREIRFCQLCLHNDISKFHVNFSLITTVQQGDTRAYAETGRFRFCLTSPTLERSKG